MHRWLPRMVRPKVENLAGYRPQATSLFKLMCSAWRVLPVIEMPMEPTPVNLCGLTEATSKAGG